MLFVQAMLLVMLMLHCLVCVFGVRLEDTSKFRNCIADPSNWGCTIMYVAPPPPPGKRVRGKP